HLGGERLSSVSPHTKGKLLTERLRPERSALDRSAILTACRANLERVRARSGLYRSCSEIRPPYEAQRDALSGTNPLALEWTFYRQAVQSYASFKYEWNYTRNRELRLLLRKDPCVCRESYPGQLLRRQLRSPDRK